MIGLLYNNYSIMSFWRGWRSTVGLLFDIYLLINIPGGELFSIYLFAYIINHHDYFGIFTE